MPKADIAPLFDHLVGTCEQRRRHGEADRLGGLKVDDELELGRGLHRQVGRLLALEDAIDVARGLPVLDRTVRPVRDQAAGAQNRSSWISRRELEAGGKCGDQIAVKQYQRRPPSRSGRHWRPAKAATAFSISAPPLTLIGVNSTAKRRPGLNRAPLASTGGTGRIPKDPNAVDARCNLFQQFQPFRRMPYSNE